MKKPMENINAMPGVAESPWRQAAPAGASMEAATAAAEAMAAPAEASMGGVPAGAEAMAAPAAAEGVAEAHGRRILTFATADRARWREWLAANFETQTEVLFVFPTAASGEEGISYNDAVEEALCFGWIDGVAGNLDSTHSTRRFTPRRKGSPYSRPNIERLIWLEERGMIHPKVLPSVLPVIREPYVFPADIMAELGKYPDALAFFESCPAPYRRIRVAYVDAAR